MITLGIILLLAGAFIATQNTASKLSGPLMIAGGVLILLGLLA